MISSQLQEVTRHTASAGAVPQVVFAAGQLLRTSSGFVSEQLGTCAAALALEAEAHHEVIWLAVQRVASSVRGLLERLRPLYEGPDALIHWNPASRQQSRIQTPDSVESLLRRLRQLSYARSEVAQAERSGLRHDARIGIQDLLARKRLVQGNTAELPDPGLLSVILRDLSVLEQAVENLLSLPTRLTSLDWAGTLCLRVIEQIQPVLDQAKTLMATDPEASDRMLATLQGLVVLLESLETPVQPFAELLSPDCLLEGSFEVASRDLLLRPRPEIQGGRYFPVKLTYHASRGLWLATTQARQDGQWDHPTWFEQPVYVQSQNLGWIDVAPCEPIYEVVADSPRTSLLTSADEAPQPSWTSHHALIDYSGPTNYSASFALINQVLLSPSDAPPSIGDVLRFGPQGGYRLEVSGVDGVATFPGIYGSYRPVQLSDTFGDLAGDALTVSSWLTGLASSTSNPLPVSKLSGFFYLGYTPLQVYGLNLDPNDGLRVAFRVHEPYSNYYFPSLAGEVDKAVDEAGTPTYPYSVRLLTSFPSDPIGDAGWSCHSALYLDFSLEQTRCLRVTAPVSGGAFNTLREWALSRPIRLQAPGFTWTGFARDLRLAGDDTYDSDNPLLPAKQDVLLFLFDPVPSGLSYRLEVLPPGSANTVELSTPSPWRGYNCALDLAPGDWIYFPGSMPAQVVESCVGPKVRLAGSQEGLAGLEGLRVRFVSLGDLLLQHDRASQTARVFSVEDLDSQGIWVKPSQGDIPESPLDGDILWLTSACMLKPQDHRTTRFSVLDQEGNPILLEKLSYELRTEFASALGRTPKAEDLLVTLVVAGGSQRASIVSEHEIKLPGLPWLCSQGSVAATYAVRLRATPPEATLTQQEAWVDASGQPEDKPAGGSILYDLERKTRTGFASLYLPAEIGAQAVTLTTGIKGTLRGPVVTRGSKSGPGWSLCEYRLQRRITPSVSELESDLGRALIDLGAVRTLALTLSEAQWSLVTPNRIRINTTGGLSLTQLEGMETGFGGDVLDIPIRVAKASEDLRDSGFTLLDLSVSLSSPVSGSLRLYDQQVGVAWRQLQSHVRYLKQLQVWLAYVSDPESRWIRQAIQRLRSAGANKAAWVVENAQVERWTDLVSLASNNRAVSKQAQALLDSLGRQR